MLSFLMKRLGAGLVLVFAISAVTFLLLRATGQNVARSIVGQTATADQVAAKQEELGLNRPVLEQFGQWLAGVVRGDFGSSWYSGEAVTSALSNRLPVTLSIVLGGLLLSAVLSVLLGAAAATRGGWLDRFVQVAGVIGFAIPSFLVALVLALYLGVKWQLLPATGYTALAASPGEWFASIVMPSIALAIGAMAATAQQIRGSMVDVLRLDYIRTLKSRGISSRSLLYKHALRNAAPAGLTVLSLQFIAMVGGAVVVEKVFGLNGIGSLANSAASQGDAPQLLGVVVVMVTIVVLVNLLLDVALGWLNPKVRVQ
ncbi:ABC transporter permease [Actinoplanes sp. NPDC051851]|uniref:ABC transporter permease n=1 Tax=Actinoplanes sp. NPDC051851 TaxID=3154753 RepID=UPI0034232077